MRNKLLAVCMILACTTLVGCTKEEDSFSNPFKEESAKSSKEEETELIAKDDNSEFSGQYFAEAPSIDSTKALTQKDLKKIGQQVYTGEIIETTNLVEQNDSTRTSITHNIQFQITNDGYFTIIDERDYGDSPYYPAYYVNNEDNIVAGKFSDGSISTGYLSKSYGRIKEQRVDRLSYYNSLKTDGNVSKPIYAAYNKNESSVAADYVLPDIVGKIAEDGSFDKLEISEQPNDNLEIKGEIKQTKSKPLPSANQFHKTYFPDEDIFVNTADISTTPVNPEDKKGSLESLNDLVTALTPVIQEEIISTIKTSSDIDETIKDKVQITVENPESFIGYLEDNTELKPTHTVKVYSDVWHGEDSFTPSDGAVFSIVNGRVYKYVEPSNDQGAHYIDDITLTSVSY